MIQNSRFKAISLVCSLGIAAALLSSAGAAVILGSFEMTGDQEAPSSGSSLVGYADYSLNTDLNKVTLLLKFVGDVDLDGKQTQSLDDDVTGLHIRKAAPGSDGPIVFGILGSGQVADGTVLFPSQNQVYSVWEAGDGASDQMENLLAGNLYLNLDTVRFPEGEVRGQFSVPVPEPSSAVLVGVPAIAYFLRRKRRSGS